MLRNLLYHVTPLPGWKDNVETLKKYLPQFSGVKIGAVVYGPGMDDYERAVVEAGKLFDYTLSIPNSVTIRETATLSSLLQALEGTAFTDGITFYGHTKGVTHQVNRNGTKAQAVKLWTKLCYEKNLENIPAIEELLKTFSCAGTFKRYGYFSHFPSQSAWHYSGTFYWFRNDRLFVPDVDYKAKVDLTRYGAEAFPSLMWREDEAACVFGDNCQNAYDLVHLRKLIADDKAAKVKKPTLNYAVSTNILSRITALEAEVAKLKLQLRGGIGVK